MNFLKEKKNNRINFNRCLIFGEDRIANINDVSRKVIQRKEKVLRGLKKNDTPILTGYQIFHNYIRPHEGLKGKTPAQACGIEIEGENKWITLIQNASIKPTSKN